MRWVARGLVGVLLALGAATASGRVRLEPVLTGSMSPRIPVGSLVAVTPVHDVSTGDVVMFAPPRPYGTPHDGPVLHRVVQVTRGLDGHVLARTKGDANTATDPWVLDVTASRVSELRFSSPLAGRVVAAARGTTRGTGLLVWAGAAALAVLLTPRQRYAPRHG